MFGRRFIFAILLLRRKKNRETMREEKKEEEKGKGTRKRGKENAKVKNKGDSER
jgi:hypothetical protein